MQRALERKGNMCKVAIKDLHAMSEDDDEA
jgi:hypothetical protein